MQTEEALLRQTRNKNRRPHCENAETMIQRVWHEIKEYLRKITDISGENLWNENCREQQSNEGSEPATSCALGECCIHYSDRGPAVYLYFLTTYTFESIYGVHCIDSVMGSTVF